MDISTYSELENQMEKICNNVIENVSEFILEDLKEFIKNDTYGSHGRNVVYESSMEFMNAWEWTPVKNAAKELSKELFYHWQTLQTNPATYKHIDYVTGRDNRERLADLLNINGLEEGNPISVFRYAFWNNFTVQMFLSGKILSYFDSEFGKFGIKR